MKAGPGGCGKDILMTAPTTVAIDAMGGDHGPEVTLAGVSLVRQRTANVRFLLVGDEAKIRPLLEADPALARVSEVVHADVQAT